MISHTLSHKLTHITILTHITHTIKHITYNFHIHYSYHINITYRNCVTKNCKHLQIYDPHLINLMGQLLHLHQQLGILNAKRNWINCRDLNGVSSAYKNISYDINSLNKQINTLTLNIDLNISDTELEQLKLECTNELETSMENHESKIEKEHRPLELNYNEKALILMTQKPIPHDIKIGLSFGWKFLFPYVTTDENIHQVLAELEKCIDETIPMGFQNEAFLSTAIQLSERENFQENNTIQWLCFIALRTKRFFKNNKDIFATRSDKGGHTVVIDMEKYEESLQLMLDDDTSYEIINENPLKTLIEKEKKIIKFLKTNQKTKNLATANVFFEPDVKQLAKFYGLPKVHKQTFSLRPITAMHMAPGYSTGKIMNEILNGIFPRTHIHVKDSYDMKEFCDTAIIMEDHNLVSYDAVKMYTSIPRELVKQIIFEQHIEISQKYGLAKRVLENILNFLLTDCTVFTALDNIYKQKEGLPMGGCISTALARITMDRVVEHLYNHVKDISFIKVFVDDTIAAMKPELIDTALSTLNSFHPEMKFTKELENDNKSINFLNLTLTRDGNFIDTNWYRKVFASGRLLNFYSSHKRTTIIGTAKAFIQTVLKLSDPMHFHTNKPKIEQTLRDNSFPETLITILMNTEYTFMPRHIKKPTNNIKGIYKTYPQAVCKSREIKRALLRLKEKNIIYAESTRNTKINFVTTRKTFTPQIERTNTILLSKCICGEKYKITSTKFNETGEMAAVKRILTNHTGCDNNRGHAFRKVKVQKGLHYKKQTDYLLKYVKWMYRGKVLNTEFSLPNHHFANLMKKSKKHRK